MLDRDSLLARVDAVMAARVRGDSAGLLRLCVDDAKYEMVGQASALRGFPVGPEGAASAIPQLIDLVTFHSAERDDAIVEGNRAMIRIRASATTAGVGPHELLLCQIWQFDDAGQVVSVTEYSDTAGLAERLATGLATA